MMKHITSLTNPLVKDIVRLHDAKGRRELQLFVAEGVRTCQTIIQGGILPEYLIVTEHTLQMAQTMCPEDKIIVITPAILAKISTVNTPSGLIGVFPIPHQATELTSGIVLAEIADPGNMGTLIRTCAALGKQTVVVIGGVDPFSPKVIQASAGTIASVNIVTCSWQDLLKMKAQLFIGALVVSGGKNPKDLPQKEALLVIGSEAHGIRQEWLQGCDGLFTLPMPGKTESLNAAIAGSIAMYITWSN